MIRLFRSKEEKYYDYLVKETRKDKRFLYGKNPKYESQDEILLGMYGKCDPLKAGRTVKIITIADTHGQLYERELMQLLGQHPDYDICILLGDHTYHDIEIIKRNVVNYKLYGLLGNHDTSSPDYLSAYGIKNLASHIVDIHGIRILGVPGSFRYKPETFPSFSQAESIKYLNSKGRADILVSHDAPFGVSKKQNAVHSGLFGITYYLYKNHVPYCLHGHTHMRYSKELPNGTKVRCCYMCEYLEIGQND